MSAIIKAKLCSECCEPIPTERLTPRYADRIKTCSQRCAWKRSDRLKKKQENSKRDWNRIKKFW